FVVGGGICTLGQILTQILMNTGMDEKTASAWTLLILIGSSVILTGCNIYPKIVKFGGAGALVPITGFANSVAAPAIEYQAEGQVFGIGCKIFTIAGPVILYGILSSWILGIFSYLLQFLGIMNG
ncbi:MAG: SpoVA/SpoVAEb family sporulation membrane protein, partial [Hungatella sp.]